MLTILSHEAPAFPEGLAEPRSGQVEQAEFEWVVGKRQLASLGFLVLVLVALLTAGSYLFGKAVSSLEIAPVPMPAAPPPPAVWNPNPPAVQAETSVAPPAEPPLFDDPAPNAIYIQMGAVDKGIAVVFAEGLRKRGFDSFIAPGPNPRIFRVLIGPFRSAEAYQSAQKAVNTLGLTTFSRRYSD